MEGSPAMPSERIQRQIDRLLDAADAAFAQREWTALRQHARDVLLLDRFRGNETHAGTTCGFADCLRIVGVVLVGLHKWLHKLRGDQPHGMTRRSQPPRPIMRTSTRFQSYDAAC